MKPTRPPAARVRIDPLGSADLDALFPVLDDGSLHGFIGGRPRTRPELARWIEAVTAGAPPGERWCNWVIRRTADGATVGTVQATVVGDEASVAWVVGSAFQGHGYATEAAEAMVALLRADGVTRLRAAIHPEHAASQAVARHLGLVPTAEVDDGEVVWRSPA